MGEVSASYPSLFTPAGYAFSIWGLIYFAFMYYCVKQLQTSRLEKKVYNQLSLSLLLLNLLAAVWIWVFTSRLLAVSVAIIAIMLLLSIDMFVSSSAASKQKKHSWWLQFPFSLLFGWLSVAFLANLSVLIASMQQKPNSTLAITFVILAGLASLIISLSFSNAVYPAVIAWALMAVYIARKSEDPQIAFSALITASLSAVLVIIEALRAGSRRRLAD